MPSLQSRPMRWTALYLFAIDAGRRIGPPHRSGNRLGGVKDLRLWRCRQVDTRPVSAGFDPAGSQSRSRSGRATARGRRGQDGQRGNRRLDQGASQSPWTATARSFCWPRPTTSSTTGSRRSISLTSCSTSTPTAGSSVRHCIGSTRSRTASSTATSASFLGFASFGRGRGR